MEQPLAPGFVSTEILPAPMAAYAGRRRAPKVSDQALTGTTRAWLRRLPPRRKPLNLCEAYPRVANRIAFCWPEPTLTSQVLEDLLVDKRGNRRGFPSYIRRELQRLVDYNDQHRPAEQGGNWWEAIKRIAYFE